MPSFARISLIYTRLSRIPIARIKRAMAIPYPIYINIESVVVIIAGPPPVMANTRPNAPKVDNVTITNVVAIVLFIMGSVILSKIWNPLAPSILAASTISSDILSRDAWNIIME